MERTIKKKICYEKLPFDITRNDDDFNFDIQKTHGKYSLLVGPKKYYLPAAYEKLGLDIYNFEARPDDVYLLGYPRSGTTLHAEMVWLIGNDLNYEEAAKNVIDYRFPMLDFELLGTIDGVKKLSSKTSLDENSQIIADKYSELSLMGLKTRDGRRFLKSHLPISLNPPHIFEVGAKVIYCARSPKDLMVSLYHARKTFDTSLEESFESFFSKFKNSKMTYLPYFEHLKEGWARRNDENFLFLFYEDTIKDKTRTIVRIANFLNKSLTKEQVEALVDHLSFANFKKNKSVNNDHFVKLGLFNENNNFIRSGKRGGWRDYFKGELEKEANAWIEENLQDSDIKFPDYGNN